MNVKPADPRPTKPIHVAVSIGIGQLRIGDRIVTKTDANGFVTHSYGVTHIEPCPGSPEKIHVNRSDCYDSRFANVRVARLVTNVFSLMDPEAWS